MIVSCSHLGYIISLYICHVHSQVYILSLYLVMFTPRSTLSPHPLSCSLPCLHYLPIPCHVHSWVYIYLLYLVMFTPQVHILSPSIVMSILPMISILSQSLVMWNFPAIYIIRIISCWLSTFPSNWNRLKPVSVRNLDIWSCSTVLYCTVLYCTVLYCTVLYCTVLYCTVLYCTVLYCTVMYCTVLYCTVLYCTVLYCTVMYCTVLYCTAVLTASIARILSFDILHWSS